MTLENYLTHYFKIKEMLIFLLISLVCAFVFMLILVLFGRLSSSGNKTYKQKKFIYQHTHNLVQRFYEMIFSATSILSFLSLYYLIDRFVTSGDFRVFWDKHSDMLLLAMIIISVLVNNYLDHLLIPLKKIDYKERGAVRVIGMLYIFMIFFYIKFIYENDNYDGFIMYFLGLMVGRFVYFDTRFTDFINTIKQAFRNMPILILGLTYTGIMCYIGFSSDYLLKSNGVLVSTFIAHIYMVIAIFIIHHSHLIDIFVKKPVKQNKSKQDIYDDETDEYSDEYEVSQYDDYEEYDNYEE